MDTIERNAIVNAQGERGIDVDVEKGGVGEENRIGRTGMFVKSCLLFNSAWCGRE